MIQACDRSGSPGPLSWAVPVLAATGMPLSRAMQQLAVPGLGDADHQVRAACRPSPGRSASSRPRAAVWLEHRAVVVERLRRRRTASSSARRWRPWRRPSPCAAAPSGPRSGRSRGSPAAGGSGPGPRWRRTCWPPGGGGRSGSARRRPSRRRPGPSARRRCRPPVWANGMLQLRVNTSVRSPPQRAPLEVLDRVVGLRRHPRRARRGTCVDRSITPDSAARCPWSGP